MSSLLPAAGGQEQWNAGIVECGLKTKMATKNSLIPIR
jgi:hypothetical protein